MNHLKKIILINSLFPYEELDLNASLHFFGENGTGKTSLLRAVAGFYTGKFSQNAYEADAFSLYLPRKDSWIVYEVKGTKGLFTVAVNRTLGSPSFYFINGDYEEAIFRQKTKGKSAAKVIEAIKSRKLHFVGPLEEPGEYLEILYGTYEGKDKSEVRKFCLSPSQSIPGISSIMGRLFQQEALSLSFIKNILFDLEGLSGSITNLDKIKDGLKEFKRELRDIRAFQAAEDAAKEVLRNLDAFLLEEQEEVRLANELRLAFPEHNAQSDLLKQKEEMVEQELVNFAKQTGEAHTEKLDYLKALYQKMGVLTYKLSEAKKKKAYYEEGQMRKKQLRYEELSYKKFQLIHGDFISQGDSQIEEELIAEKLQREYLEASLLKEQQLKEIEQNIRVRDQEFEKRKKSGKDIILTNQELLKEHEIRLGKINKELDELAMERLRLEGKFYYSNEIQQAQKDIYQKLEESLGYRLSIKRGEEQIADLQKRKDAEFLALERGIKEQENTCKERLALLKKEQEVLASQIANSNRAFMGWLEKNYPNWQQSIGKILKKEVLLSPFLNPGIERLNDLFYGIHLDLSDLPESQLDLRALSKKNKELLDKIEALERAQVKRRKNDESKKATRENYYRQKNRSYKRNLQKDEYALQQIENAIKKWEGSIDRYQQQGVQERSAQLLKISYKEADLKKALEKEIHEKEELEKRTKAHLEQLEAELLSLKKDIDKASSLAIEAVKKNWTKFLKDWEKRKDSEDKDKPFQTDDLLEWESLHEEILTYKFDKRTFLDPTRFWELEQKELTLRIKNCEAEYRLVHEEKERYQKDLQQKQKEAKELRKDWRQAEHKWQEVKDSTVFEQIKSLPQKTRKKEEAKIALSFDLLLSKLKVCTATKAQTALNLRKSLQRFNSFFSEDNGFGFFIKPEGEAAIKGASAALKKFLEEEKVIDFAQAAHLRHATLLSSLAEESKIWEKSSEQLEKWIERLNHTLSEDSDLLFWEDSHFAITSSRKTIFQVLKEIQRFQKLNGQALGSNSLFNQGDKLSVNTEAFDLLIRLDSALNMYPNRVITPADTCDVFIIDRDKKALDSFPEQSPGVQRLVEVIIGIFLIEKVLEIGEGAVQVHLLLDNFNQFHPKAIQLIQDKAEKAGLKLCTAAVRVAQEGKYDWVYQMEKGKNQVFKTQQVSSALGEKL